MPNIGKDFWAFCSNAVTALKKEPYQAFLFSCLVLCVVTLPLLSDVGKLVSVLAVFVVGKLCEQRMRRQEAHAEAMARLEIEKIEAEGHAKVRELRLEAELKRTKLEMESSPTKSLPSSDS